MICLKERNLPYLPQGEPHAIYICPGWNRSLTRNAPSALPSSPPSLYGHPLIVYHLAIMTSTMTKVVGTAGSIYGEAPIMQETVQLNPLRAGGLPKMEM